MERRLESFSRSGGRVLIVRAGDFFGPAAGNNWFSQGLVRPGHALTRISYPGTAGIGHEWAYIPDVARTIVELLAQADSLAPFATFHMAGHWDHDGAQMTQAIQRVVARRTGVEPRVSGFPWMLLKLASPFVTTFREMMEMRYLWRQPLRLDNTRLRAVLGDEPRTPLDEAVETTLLALGCLGDARSPHPQSGRA
jgi:nucleoside-diphosphate-sugar epimerase